MLEVLAAVLAAVPAPEFAVVKRWLAAVESLVVVALLAADSVRLAAAKSPVTLMVPGLVELVLEELVLRWPTRW